jgi:membrane protein
VFRRLRGVGLARTAAALSFMSVLGLVPLFTVAFVVVARYPLFERWLGSLERFLLRHLIPASAGAVRPWLAEFTTKAAELQGYGIALVVVTAMLLVATVDREINAIFRVREQRSLVRRLTVYAVGLTFGPLSIGAAVHSTQALLAATLDVAPFTERAVIALAVPVAVALATLAFTLVYTLLPATRVPFPAALAGGLAAALGFEAAKRGFVLYVLNVPTYERVYGTLSVLPLFLVWIYVSWLIVLVGAAITATLAEGPSRRRGRGS